LLINSISLQEAKESSAIENIFTTNDELYKAYSENTSEQAEANSLWIIDTARAEVSAGNLYAVLVWDEQPTGDGPGGTSHFAEAIRHLGGHLTIINPTKL
jgi:hypothetical protein